MARVPLLALRNASISFGGRPTFSDISLAIGAGERVCLVGRNGSGKSTLLKALAGLIETDKGERFVQPGTQIAYMQQAPYFDEHLTAAQFIALGLPPDPEHNDRSYLIDAVLEEVEMRADRQLINLSGGESRRLSLAQALVGDPDILLLDEPTNHLDIPAVEWLEEKLLGLSAGILTISHDRAFLKRLSRRTLWLDRGALKENDQGYGNFEEWSEGILAAEEAADARLDKRILSEAAWARQGIPARRKRNQGRLRALGTMRSERAQRVTTGEAKLGSAAALAGGRLVAELEHVAKSFEDVSGTKIIATDFSTRILRGDRVGFIGRNGAGKSTLLGIIAGSIDPDSGEAKHGANLMPAIFDQLRTTLDPNKTPWETLTGGGSDTVDVQGRPKHVASYLKDFLFEERQYRAKINSLSGGERHRLLLAKILAQPSNLLILDEPTNDLDIETLDLLEEVLAEYQGTLLLVSHDRDFLDRLVTSIIAVEGDGIVHEYVGGYTDYLRQRRAIPVAAKAAPATPAPKSRDEAPRERPAAKLPYRDQKDLEALPGQIAKLEADKAAIEQRLADPDLATKDRVKFKFYVERHRELVAALGQAEEKWLALAERAEALSRAPR